MYKYIVPFSYYFFLYFNLCLKTFFFLSDYETNDGSFEKCQDTVEIYCEYNIHTILLYNIHTTLLYNIHTILL